ncbi:MAG: arsenate reductase ArsC [Candidatus Nitrosotalea sp.]|nr:arsenate reductase ArsC [Candidatus Nitrosotalea sp.]
MNFTESSKDEKKILFVCVENAGRSQMAEAFFRKYAPKGYESESAGTKPTLDVNPVVVEAMKEIGIDIGKQKPKVLTSQFIADSILSVNMGCMDKTECPAVFMKNSLDWNIEDPKGQSIDKVREIRDNIELKVKDLCKTLE